MNVVLIGYRGTGKSSVAARLAEALGLRAVSLDAQIVRRAGRPVPEIVAAVGWPGFRDLEEDVVREVAAGDGQVIDCGGGVVEREANFGPLRAAGPVIWLRASPGTIVSRIGSDTQRPSLTGTKSFTDEVEEVLARREPLYARLADYAIDTDGISVDEVTARAVAFLRRRASAAPAC